MPNVLIFENDSTFAAELDEGLRALGCEITIASDANVGLQSAAVNRPDLILLAIELPRMNGFSVCNKLKRDPALKGVPLIIMSTDSTDETFEQHKRLRTRAEDYIHKPISFGQLLGRVRALVAIGGEGELGEDDLVVDEDIVLEEDDVLEIDEVPPEEPVDDDVDDFTEAAFDNLISEPEQPQAIEASEELLSADDQMVPAGDSGPPDSLEIGEPSIAPPPVASAPSEAQLRLVQDLEQQIAEAKSRIDELEQQARAKERLEAEVQSLVEQLDDAKARISSGKGASARDVLDLREQLNRKDKEILEVRDSLTHREKELLSLKDGTLDLERSNADLNDKIEELSRRISELERLNDALGKDKEQASKRSDDYKRRTEKAKAELDERAAELLQEREQVAALKSELDRALGAAAEEQNEAVAAAEKRGRDAVAEAVAVAQAEADRERQQAVAAAESEAERAKQEALADAQAESEQALANIAREVETRMAAVHSEALQAAERMAAERLAARESELVRQLEQAQKLATDREAQIAVVQQEQHEALAAIAEREAKISSLEGEIDGRIAERDAARRDAAGREERALALEGELSALRGQFNETRQQLEAETSRLEAARTKWIEDKAALERAKDGMAAALVQIDEIEARTLD